MLEILIGIVIGIGRVLLALVTPIVGFGKDGKGAMIREDVTHTLGTLASKAGLKTTSGGVSGNFGEDFRVLKTEGYANIAGLTIGNGALALYMVNGELTLAEVEEAIELSGPNDRNDRKAMEQAERWVRFVGAYVPQGSGSVAALNGTGRLEFNPRWTFSDPEMWDWVVYNATQGALDTGAVAAMKLTHYGVWVT